MKSVKPIFNFIVFVVLIGLNIWLFQKECGYSVKKVSDQLRETQTENSIEKMEVYVLEKDQDFTRVEIDMSASLSQLEKMMAIFSQIKEKQNRKFTFIPDQAELLTVFSLKDSVSLRFTGIEPGSLSIFENYLLAKTIRKNFQRFFTNPILIDFGRKADTGSSPVIFNSKHLTNRSY